MSKSHAEILKEIQALQREAAALRAREAPGVIEKIKLAMEAYQLTADDLGFGGDVGRKPNPIARGDARYSDGKGNTWIGRGPRPSWLKFALTAGATLEDFAVGAPANSAVRPTPQKAAEVRGTAVPSARFLDPVSGKTWTGRGPKPGWIRDGLAQGKKLSDFTC